MLYLLFWILLVWLTPGSATEPTIVSDDIYWNTPEYKERPIHAQGRFVYHARRSNFIGDQIVPLNRMPLLNGYAEIHKAAIAKYTGREHLLRRVIPTLGCLWNDVIFLSPLHPHKQYEEYRKIGFAEKKALYFKIPIEILQNKRVTVWNWLSYKKYPHDDPIHSAIESYCAFDFVHYQEMEDLPEDTKEFYWNNFDLDHPEKYPRFHWYRIPHILCQDPIDLTDKRITLIDWRDSIEESLEYNDKS